MKETIHETFSKELLGKQITFKGNVVNCKAGPCLQLIDGTILYVRELNDDFVGKEIVVMGLFQRKKIIPDPIVDKTGAISTGAHGDQLVLENIKIKE